MKIIGYKEIPLEQLRVSKTNIRKTLLEREKKALKYCLKKKKVLDILTVIYNEDDQTYEIIKGQRRYLAAVELKAEGLPITKLPCIVKEMTEAEAIEESLLDELMRVAVEPNDTGNAILKLIEHYGSLGKVATELGIEEDWLGYYVQHLSLNPPAPVYEAKETSTKETSLETFTKEEEAIKSGESTEIKFDPFLSLSLEERKEAQRRLTENPKASPIIIKSAVKDWIDNTYELQFRLENLVYRALNDYAKNKKITVRRALDLLINKLLKEHLKKEKFM